MNSVYHAAIRVVNKKDLPNLKKYIKKSLRYPRQVCYNSNIGATAPKFFLEQAFFIGRKKSALHFFFAERIFGIGVLE